MNIGELIAKLKKFDQQLPVVTVSHNKDRHGYFDVEVRQGYVTNRPGGTFYENVPDDEQPNVVLINALGGQEVDYFVRGLKGKP